MKAVDLSTEELRNEVYKLRRNLMKNMRRVEELSSSPFSVPNYAEKHLGEITKEIKKTPIKNMSDKQLRSTYRKLKYIEGLKSSTLEGAKETIASGIEEVKEKLSSMSEKKQDKFWDLYEEALHKSGTFERFKYEIFDVYVDKVRARDNTGQIAENLEKLLKQFELYEETDNEASNRYKFRTILEDAFDSGEIKKEGFMTENYEEEEW